MGKKISISLTVSLIALTAALTCVLTMSYARRQFNEKISEVDRLSQKYQRLEELDAKVQDEYYTEISADDVTDGMLAGYVRGLGDPYSAYRSAKELSEYEDSNAGVYTGVGISVTKNDEGYAEIVSVIEEGSADQAGLIAGDLIVEVEGVSVKESYREAIDQFFGEQGTTVQVKVKKADSGKIVTYKLLRAQIDEITVESKLLRNRIGYIRIMKFRSVTVSQFETARQELLKKGAQALIFDVRDNGGGVLSALEQLIDPLLPEGELAFATDRSGKQTTIIESDAGFEEMPYCVLVNGNTASASELFACLLRDYSDAILIGEKTFGKGIMQTTFALSSGGVTLTTATYETGVTPCYHGVGLEPDVLVEADPDSEDDVQLDAAVDAIIARIKENNAA